MFDVSVFTEYFVPIVAADWWTGNISYPVAES